MGFKITLTEVGVKACALKLSYLKTIQAILKFIELILSVAVTCTVAYYINAGPRVSGDLFFLSMIVTFVICTFCLFISEWVVWSATEVISKSMFEIVFFIVSVILLSASSINLFTNVIAYYNSSYGIYLAYVIITVSELLLIGLHSTDIILNLCLNCCRKKKTTTEDFN